MKPSSLIPYVAILALQVLAVWGLLFAVDVKVSEILPVADELPDRVGDWTGEGIWFCLNRDCDAPVHRASELSEPGICPACGEPLNGGSRAEMTQLPPDTRIRKKRYEHPSGEVLTASYVVSGKGRASLHRPQVCLTDGGNEIARERVIGVPMSDEQTLRVSLLDLEHKGTDPSGAPALTSSYYAYWFSGVRHETPYHIERMVWMAADKVFRSTASRWAYVAVSGTRTPGSENHQETVREFITQFHPLVRRRGPEP